ncbi:IS66 family insertion sequence element accessory protein TnpB [Paracoccus sp. FO-3]|uniref:IS66 family insertion sequence element accessory protein TnpB n=1 Tax=Paracoccus sp. FO-3 TaxID=1335059 RepID=UPI00351350C2
MIAFPAGVRVWIAGGVTDMRCGMNGLALKVQEGLGRKRKLARSSASGGAGAIS